MHNTWSLIHLISIGLWGGCVATEMVLEVKARQDEKLLPIVAVLHHAIDRLVELPIVFIVLFSGLMQVPWGHLASIPTILWIKISAGLVAVLANLWCYIPVQRRFSLVKNCDHATLVHESNRVFKAFYVGFTAGALALSLGIFLQ